MITVSIILSLPHYFLVDIENIDFPENPQAYEERLIFKWIKLEEMNLQNLLTDILKELISKINQPNQPAWAYNTYEK